MNTNGPEFGSELRKRQTPELARRERRKQFWALLFGVVLGAVLTLDALYARSHGGLVDGGPGNGFLKIPWWAAGVIGLFILAASGYALWRHAIESREGDRS